MSHARANLCSIVLGMLVVTFHVSALDNPLKGPLNSGTWKSIRGGHSLIYLEGNRLLDWEPETGRYRIWRYDRVRTGNADPLPGGPIVEGVWKSIGEGHQLVYLGGDRLLDWEPETGNYRVWHYHRDKTGEENPLSHKPVAEGTWTSIKMGHTLIYMGGDTVLDWEAQTGHYRLWAYDPDRKGADDPFPGKPLAEGVWKSIKDGHHLMQFNGDRVLDWEDTGRFRIWRYDLTARGKEDPFPGSPLVEGDWKHVGPKHRFVYLDGDHILEWDGLTGNYHVWNYEQGVDAMDAKELAAEENAAARAQAAKHRQELENARREAIAQAQEDAKNEAEFDRLREELAEIKARKQQDDIAVARAREEAQRKYEIERAKREIAKARQEEFLARQRALAMTRQAVVAVYNPLATSSQNISTVVRWKMWDGSYTQWAASRIPDKRSLFYNCAGAVSFQIKFNSSTGEKNYALEANQMPSDVKATADDARPYSFSWGDKNILDLYNGKPKK